MRVAAGGHFEIKNGRLILRAHAALVTGIGFDGDVTLDVDFWKITKAITKAFKFVVRRFFRRNSKRYLEKDSFSGFQEISTKFIDYIKSKHPIAAINGSHWSPEDKKHGVEALKKTILKACDESNKTFEGANEITVRLAISDISKQWSNSYAIKPDFVLSADQREEDFALSCKGFGFFI